MTAPPIVLLTSRLLPEPLAVLPARVALTVPSHALHVVHSIEQLDEAIEKYDGELVLLTAATSVIVPARSIARLRRTPYNFHAASPAFPGRDPHHWAVYDGAKEYGATVHVLTERVDAGVIVGVELFDVPADIRPTPLMALANEALLRLVDRFVPQVAVAVDALPAHGARWGSRKTTRADFRAICLLPPNISSAEFARRLRAFDGEEFRNLTIQMHGHLFRIIRDEG